MSRKALLINLGADLNASSSLGIRPAEARPSIAEVLLREQDAEEAIRPGQGAPKLALITDCAALDRMDRNLRNVREPERRLADVIKTLVPQFDAIVLDSPAGYSLVARSVPIAADEIVVPIRAEYLALE